MTSSAEVAAPPTMVLRDGGWCGPDDTQMLAKARAEALNLVQWLARIAQQLRGGGHAGAAHRARRSAPPTRHSSPGRSTTILRSRCACRVWKCSFSEHGKPMPHILDPEEHSPAEVEAWILVELLHRGIDRDEVLQGTALHDPGSDDRRCGRLFAASLRRKVSHNWRLGFKAAAVLGAACAVGMDEVASFACRRRLISCGLVGRRESGPARVFAGRRAEPDEPYFYAATR